MTLSIQNHLILFNGIFSSLPLEAHQIEWYNSIKAKIKCLSLHRNDYNMADCVLLFGSRDDHHGTGANFKQNNEASRIDGSLNGKNVRISQVNGRL